MFEYILAGFTGSFFSYFCIFWSGVEFSTWATDTVSERIIRETNEQNKNIEKKMDQILREIRHQNVRPILSNIKL
jgi:hypothetical protein